MNILDIDWAYMRATFMVVAVLMLVPQLFAAAEKLGEHYGEKIDAYLLRLDDYLSKMSGRFERKARKTRR
jgi:hypothetical protein